MHKKFNTILLTMLTLVMAACSTPPTPTATATNEPPTQAPTPTSVPVLTPEFNFYGDDPSVPIVPSGISGEWDSKYINPGAMLFHDGKFHMFRNGFVKWPSFVAVGYMTSEDGYEWTSVQDEPVFTRDEVPYAESAVLVTSAFVMEDGTWTFIFFTFNSSTTPSVIGRATADSPLGPWTVDPEPILSHGLEGSWDEKNVRWPNVVETEDGYEMFFSGENGKGEFRIGRATSEDGITWRKYNDLDTNEDEFADSDPVLESSGGWDILDVDRPIVELTPDGYVMIFMGGILNRRGLALSQDGVHWEQYVQNPVITDNEFPIPGNTWDTALLYVNGMYYYYMEIGTRDGTDIYLTTHEGSLFE